MAKMWTEGLPYRVKPSEYAVDENADSLNGKESTDSVNEKESESEKEPENGDEPG